MCCPTRSERVPMSFGLPMPGQDSSSARGTLRILLGRYLNVPPNEVAFKFKTYTKPRLAPSKTATVDLRFNVSHSGELALVAVTTGCEVGVDVEQLRPVKQMEEIARRYFHRLEVEGVMASRVKATAGRVLPLLDGEGSTSSRRSVPASRRRSTPSKCRSTKRSRVGLIFRACGRVRVTRNAGWNVSRPPRSTSPPSRSSAATGPFERLRSRLRHLFIAAQQMSHWVPWPLLGVAMLLAVLHAHAKPWAWHSSCGLSHCQRMYQ